MKLLVLGALFSVATAVKLTQKAAQPSPGDFALLASTIPDGGVNKEDFLKSVTGFGADAESAKAMWTQIAGTDDNGGKNLLKG